MSARGLRRARLLLLAAIVAWFLSPPDWRYAVPLWLPFLVALVLEGEFLLGGLLRSSRLPAERGRAPQRVDLEQFGWVEGETPEEDDPAFWSSPPVRRARPSHLRRAGVSLLVVGFVTLVVWQVGVRRGWSSLDRATQAQVERVASAQAARIAGHGVDVRCDSSGTHVGAVQETDGIAEVGGRNAWLAPSICFQLYRVVDHRDTHAFDAAARAIAVLAHEAWHLHGVADEGVANCYAFQSGVGIGIRLGLSPGRARALMREQLATNAFDSQGDPRYLVPVGCRNGGRFDLAPSSALFP